MEIKTKFNIGNVLFTIKDMRIISFTVRCVSVFAKKEEINVSYFEEGILLDSHKEEDCFASQEELLAYIQGK